MAIAKNKIRTLVCLNCGKVVTKRMPASRKYCSLDCYRKSKRPNRRIGMNILCHCCGKEFYRPVSAIGKINFCSKQCHDLYQ